MNDRINKDKCESLKYLESVLNTLTGPDGCPWDKEQTPRTLADYIVEESHELAAAIRSGNSTEVCEEMGDITFLLLFVALYYEKKGIFSFANALDSASAKMIRRHPHVFGNTHFENLSEQLQEWERIKKQEKPQRAGLFAGLPDSLPSLIKAYRIHSKAARAGFTWPDDEEVEKQVESEWLEWLDCVQENNEQAMRHELGDIIFTLVELGRRKGIKANEALDFACNRFLRRYGAMEKMAKEKNQDLANMPLEEQDELWLAAKEGECED